MIVAVRRLLTRSRPVLGPAVALVLASAPAALGREVTITGNQAANYGRIALQFDQPTKVKAVAENGVLVISFADPSRIRKETLASDLSRFVSAVRRDPDESGLRIALAGRVRPNVLEAGERVYVDLLPEKWAGLPPGLPPEVVTDLAERLRAAEARMRAAEARSDVRRHAILRVARLPTLSRLVFDPPPGARIETAEEAGAITLTVDGATSLDAGGERPRTLPGIAAFDSSTEANRIVVRVQVADGYEVKSFEDDGTSVVDVAKAKPPRPVRRARRIPFRPPSPSSPRPPDRMPPRPRPATAQRDGRPLRASERERS